MEHNLLNKDLLQANLNYKKTAYVAFSGGADSTALLFLLNEFYKDNLKIKAIHINHNLSQNALDWEKHCKELCERLDIDLIIKSVSVSSDGGGLESNARRTRYKVFEELLDTGDLLLTGHHSDDVAETVFLRILRGTGIEGLEGPKEKRHIGNGILIRPFLKISKKQILDFLNSKNIDFIEDESNINNKFDRNFLRNDIFPLLEERWINFPQRVNNLTDILINRYDNYKNIFIEKYNELIGQEIEVKKLKSLSKSIIKDILRFSISQCNIALPSSKIMNEIIKTFILSNPGPKSIVSWSRSDQDEPSGKIIYKNGYIIILKKLKE